MIPPPHFIAEITFHFREHGPERRRWFMFGDDCRRLVPMQMAGVEGLNTVGMWIDSPKTLTLGEKILVKCRLIAPELYIDAIQPDAKFELWDSGFFADGVVIERLSENWA